MTTILKGHVSPETAYLVDDYPYGFKLRCKIRFWLEFKPKLGFRFMSQTTNPKRAGEHWNKPKASTYHAFGGCLYLDENGHVVWAGLSEHCSGQEAQTWLETYGEGVPEAGAEHLRKWVAAKVAYAANRQASDKLGVGLKEAFQAFREA
jgi:hypothetical protein